MPYYILREFDNAGKLLSGGKMYFYISGTSTPKTVYADAALTTPLPNPVILSASGTKDIFLGSGAYRVKLTDQYDAQVAPPLDGIVGSAAGSAEGTNASFAFVRTYDDLRGLLSVPDVVYVCGVTQVGDGGAGTFQLLTGDTTGLSDDNGIILTSGSGSHVYKRVFDGYIDPLWFGAKYGQATAQNLVITKAITASVQYNFPVLIAGSVYLGSNVTVPAHASISFTDDGFFIAATAVNVTFADDSKLICSGRNFGTFVSPKIGKRVIDVLKLSNMGDASSDTRMDKLLLASTDASQRLDIDEQVSILASTWVVPNTLTISGSVTFAGTALLDWTSKYLTADVRQLFVVNSTGIARFHFGSKYARPEWFGAVADGTTDDSKALTWLHPLG